MAVVHDTGMFVLQVHRERRARSRAALLCAGALAGVAVTAGCDTGRQRPQSPNDVICLREPQTGSHIVDQRCYTRAELDERRKADQQMLENAQMRANRPSRRKDQ
jgi:hypothetical protein